MRTLRIKTVVSAAGPRVANRAVDKRNVTLHNSSMSAQQFTRRRHPLYGTQDVSVSTDEYTTANTCVALYLALSAERTR